MIEKDREREMARIGYAIATPWLGVSYTQPITAQDFNRAKAAVQRQLACLGIEEAYDVLLLNYVSFEKAMLGFALDDVVDRGRDRVELDEARREIDRHLVNLLAAGEMFTDHVAQYAIRSFGRRSGEVSKVEDFLAEQRLKLPGFRAAEYLRNAVLHLSLPITSWTLGGAWVDREKDEARLQHTASVMFDPAMLAQLREVPHAFIDELRQRGNKRGHVSWVPIVREYVEGLSKVVQSTRELFGPSEEEASAFLEGLVSNYRSAFPKSDGPSSVYAVVLNKEGRWTEEISLVFDYAERVSRLRRGNRPLVNLHRREIVG